MKEFFGINPERGKKYYKQIAVGSQANGAQVKSPFLLLRGEQDGPVLWINGAVHGAELNGSVAAWELFRETDPKALKGTLAITPIANALGFQRRDKISDLDYQDMDTSFPGKPDGTFTERIADTIYREVKVNADCLLSFHTMGPFWTAIPYTVSKDVPGADAEVTAKSHKLALAYGTEVNCFLDLANASGELPGVTRGALDITCILDGIPAFMAEMGGGGRVQRVNVDRAKQGVRNVMAYLGMLEKVEAPKPFHRRIITRRGFTRCDGAGMYVPAYGPGDEMFGGGVQGRLHYFGETLEECRLEKDKVFFIGVRFNPVVSTGDPISFIGTEWYFEEG